MLQLSVYHLLSIHRTLLSLHYVGPERLNINRQTHYYTPDLCLPPLCLEMLALKICNYSCSLAIYIRDSMLFDILCLSCNSNEVNLSLILYVS